MTTTEPDLKIINIFDDFIKYFNDKSIYEPTNYIYIDNSIKNIFAETLNELNRKYNKNCIPTDDFIECMKDDMEIKVFILKHCVLRICFLDKFNEKYLEIYKTIMNWNHTHLEQVYEIITIDKYVIIVSKKIIPIYSNSNQLNIEINHDILHKLKNEIYDLIIFLSTNNAIHRDLLTDNIGYDFETNNFVAFDFDKFTINSDNNKSKDASRMMSYFENSFNFRFAHMYK